MTKEFESFFENLDEEFSPIKEQAIKYFDEDSKIEEDGTLSIFRRPWVAPQNFGLKLFLPPPTEFFEIFKERLGFEIPEVYKNFLRKLNGCFIYDFDLHGLPKSIYTENFLDRKIPQPFDLGTANAHWKNGFKVDQKLFHFGGRAYSFEENTGYFLDEKNTIFSFLKDGKLINSWSNFSEFLKEEILIAEKMMIDEKNEI